MGYRRLVLYPTKVLINPSAQTSTEMLSVLLNLKEDHFSLITRMVMSNATQPILNARTHLLTLLVHVLLLMNKCI